MHKVSIREVMQAPALLGGLFGGESFTNWRALLAGFYGLPLNQSEREIWAKLTARSDVRASHDELWLVMGRRGGKSHIAALLAVYEACFNDHTNRLAPGEIATIRFMAADRDQARAVMRYTTGLIESNPMLSGMVKNQSKSYIELHNRTIIEIGTASFRSTRGYTYAAVICDEIALWRSDDSANPDTEILNALRPGLATLDGKLIALSSPYAKRGELYETHRDYFGKDSAVLVAQATSQTMNPLLPDHVIEKALKRDRPRALAEYMAQFRNDLEAFISREVVEGLVRSGPVMLPFDSENHYFAFVDPAGGGADEFCMAIGHREDEKAVIDAIYARKGVPANITAEYAEILKGYGLRVVTGDRYAGSWPGDEFEKHGISYRQAKKIKSDLYIDLLPALNSGRVELPADDKLVNQISNLERRTTRSGKDSIDHPRGGHDDLANVVAGLVSLLALKQQVSAVFGRYGQPSGEGLNLGYRMNQFDGTPNTLWGKQSISMGEKKTTRYQLSNGEVVTLED